MDKKNETKIGCLYARVSTDELSKVDHGSLEQQKNLGIEFAKQLSSSSGINHKIRHFLIEEKGVSGGSTNRPQYKKLLSLIKNRKIDFIIAKEISRLSRSTKDFSELCELCYQNGVALHIRGLPDLDPTTAVGEMLLNLLATIAQFERKLVMQRVKETIRSAMLNNGKINGGNVAFGFDRHPDKKGYWVPNLEELEKVIFLMRTFIETGSMKQTIDESKRLGIKGKTGKVFDYNSLRRLLTNHKYIGKMKVTHGSNDENETWVDLPHGVVVPEDLFNKVQQKVLSLDEARKNLNRRGTRVYLLTGLLFWEDGTRFSGHSGTARNGERKVYYYQPKHKVRIDAERLEKAIFKALRNAFENSKELERHMATLKSVKSGKEKLIQDRISEVRKELVKIDTDEETLVDQLKHFSTEDSSAKTLSWLEKRVGKLEEQKASLTTQLEDLKQEKQSLQNTKTDLGKRKSTLSKVFRSLEKLEPGRQRAMFREIFDKVVVSSPNKVRLFWKIPEVLTAEKTDASAKKWLLDSDTEIVHRPQTCHRDNLE